MWQAGLDWAKETHALCVVDSEGKKVLESKVAHSAEGLERMLCKLASIGPARKIPVAIERPSGLIVDTLVEAGHPVVPIHPNVLKASRPRYTAAGGKSDPGDAYILADLLRTDGHRFRTLRSHSDEIRALQAMVRTRDDLVAERVALANQLRALLESFWPGAATIFAAVDSPIALAFLDKYPTPKHAQRLGPKRMAQFLGRHGYSGRREPDQLLERLRKAPTGLAGTLEEDSKGDLVRAFVRILETLVLQLRKLTSQVEHAVAQLPTGRILMSFPRAGKVNAAQILAEIGEDPSRFQTEAQLAAEAGVAPVTYASGKHRGVVFRYACNKRLRKALTCFAGNSRFSSPWARGVYAKARARGCDHPHAVRILGRAWVRVLWRTWQDGLPYNPEKHGAAARIAA